MPKTVEQKVYEILNEDYYTLNVGGKDLKFKYATLNDIQKMSALASVLPDIDRETADTEEIFTSFRYAKHLRNIIAVTLFPDCKIKLLSFFTKRNILKHIDRIKIIEVWTIVQAILKNNHIFFYLDIITSLKGTNILKPTRETDQIAHG